MFLEIDFVKRLSCLEFDPVPFQMKLTSPSTQKKRAFSYSDKWETSRLAGYPCGGWGTGDWLPSNTRSWLKTSTLGLSSFTVPSLRYWLHGLLDVSSLMPRQAVMADMHQSRSVFWWLWPAHLSIDLGRPGRLFPLKIDKTDPLEEEATPYYDPRYLRPARLRQVVNQSYQLATKLGFGTSSTVWLARNLFQLRPCQAHFIDCANDR